MLVHDNHSWLFSYSDIVTLLLCFFIIFYILEKKIEKKNIEFQIGEAKEKVQEEIKYKKFPYVLGKEIMNSLREMNNIKSQNILLHDNSVTILIRDVKFFRTSSTILLPRAQVALKKALEQLKPFKDKIRINVRGYTDSVPIGKMKAKVWWKNNMELSIARGLRTRDFIIGLGFDKDAIYVSGEADQVSYLLSGKGEKAHESINQQKVLINSYDLMRRITLQIESR